jgi:hypothetical protein
MKKNRDSGDDSTFMYAELRVGNLKYSQSLAKEISPTGEGVNHIVKRGEFQIVQDVQSLRFVQNVNRKPARSTFKDGR